MAITEIMTKAGPRAVGKAVHNANLIWANLNKLDDKELVDVLKKLPTIKTVPTHIEGKLKARGTTVLAMMQTAPKPKSTPVKGEEE
jgi:hypothetical protein